jgi:hypothetical protein
MSEFWPPPDYRRSPNSGPHRPQQPPPGSGEGYPGYGSWGPPSGGRGQPQGDPWQQPQGGAWQQPQGGPWQQPQGDPWQQPQGGPWQQPQGPAGPNATYPYAPYPPQSAPSYAERYGYGDPYRRRGPIEPEEPPRSNVTAALLGVFLVVAVLLAAGGAYVLTHTHRQPVSATAQQTVTAIATITVTQVSLRTVTDATTNVRFNVPQDWSTTGSVAATGGFQMASPDRISGILVAAITIPSGWTFDPVAGAKGVLAGAANYGPVTYEQGPTNVSLAGATWVQVTGSYTRGGAPLREVALVTTHNSLAFVLSLISTVDTFDTANTRFFQPLEQSFTFLS